MYVPQANLSIIFNLFLYFGEYETYYLNDFMKNNWFENVFLLF